jgi:Tol biopolymer transport system component/DNA-binding winged helix-turn-helix (wHTH) protein
MSDRPAIYEFGGYHLDRGARGVSLRGRPIALAPKSFDLLLLLIERRGRVLERDELIRELWPDTVVEEANLTFQVSTLRKALGEDGSKWIETVPKHGYRFTAPVREMRPQGTAAAQGSPVSAKSPARRAWPVVAILLAAAVAVAALAWWRRRPSTEPPGALRGLIPVPLTTYPGAEIYPTLSPDGSQVAFSWDGSRDNFDIYLKLVGPGEPHRLTTDPALDFSPAWSPDGRQIAFLRSLAPGENDRCGIYVIPALGGAERRLAEIDLTTTPGAAGRLAGRLAWTPDGRWLAAAGQFGRDHPSEVWLLSGETGERRRLSVASDVHGGGDVGPAFSPDGRFLALLRYATRSVGDVYLLPLDPGYATAGPLVRLTHENRSVGGPCWNAQGNRILYSSGGALGYRTLKMVEIDLAHPQRRFEPVPLPAGEQATMLASARDRLVYAREQRDTNIWRLPLPASKGQGPTLLVASTFDEHNPDFSADGKRITFTSTRSGTEEIWVANADGSEATQMTSFGGPNTSNSRWSTDGRTILFNSRRSGSSDLYVLDVATRSTRRLTDDPSEEYEPRWSRDGNLIYFVSTQSGRPEVWKIPSGGGPAVQVTRQGGLAAFESADGRWLYYAKDMSHPSSIWRVPVDGGEETKVLDGLSYSFNFAVTDKGIYLLAVRGSSHIGSIEFFDFATGKSTSLHTLDRPFWFGFALAPDERSILFSKIDSHGSDLMLVEDLR